MINSKLINVSTTCTFLRQKGSMAIMRVTSHVLPVRLGRATNGTCEALFRSRNYGFLLNGGTSRARVGRTNTVSFILLSSKAGVSYSLIVITTNIHPTIRYTLSAPVRMSHFVRISSAVRAGYPGVCTTKSMANLSKV